MQASAGERQYIKEGVELNVRADGRGRFDYRPLDIQLGVLPFANGSARVKVDTTEVLVGVNLEIGEPDADTPAQGRVVCSATCATSVSAEFEGRGADNVQIQLAQALERLLVGSGALPLDALCITPGKLCWVVYVDALVTDSAGSVVDALSLASKAALRAATIPMIEVNPEGEVSPAGDGSESKLLPSEHVPIYVSLTKIGSAFVVDASLAEEQCMSARLHVAVNSTGRVCGMYKSGPGGIAPSALVEMTKMARRIAGDLLKRLDKLTDPSGDDDADLDTTD